MDISLVQVNSPVINVVVKNTKEMGIYYGYPSCCIAQFINKKKNTTENIFILRGNTTGFMPCDNCNERILLGDICITDLIQNRQCPFPFPMQQ